MTRLRVAAIVVIAYLAGALTLWLTLRGDDDNTASAPLSTAAAPAPQPQSEPLRQTPVSDAGAATRPSVSALGIRFVRIEPGTFLMGSPAPEEGHAAYEAQHRVTLTKPFMLATTEVTQAQWREVMGSNPSNTRGSDHPVEQVTWKEAVEFCKRLGARDGKTYRLPTEAEWEYACRAGTTTPYSTGSDAAALAEAGWYKGNAEKKSHPVGKKTPNAWGLFDMHGNVWECTADGWGDFTAAEATDPKGNASAGDRVVKGGGWTSDPEMCRAANRGQIGTESELIDVGLRLCLDVP